MIVMVVGVNLLFWRPLTAWAEQFRVEESEAAEAPRSLVAGPAPAFPQSRMPVAAVAAGGWSIRSTGRCALFGLAEHPLRPAPVRRRAGDIGLRGRASASSIGCGAYRPCSPTSPTAPGWARWATRSLLGLVTFARVVVLVVVATADLGADRGVDRA